MKKLIYFTCLFCLPVTAQNIDDNFVTFNYTQLPLTSVDEGLRSYRFEVVTDVEGANMDSTSTYQIRLDNAVSLYQKRMETWLSKMSLLQQQENSSGLSQSMNYPAKPSLDLVLKPIQHSVSTNATASGIKISGFNEGADGLLVKYTLLPLKNMKFSYSKKGEAANTKYDYKCSYVLQAKMEVIDPSNTVLFEKIVGGTQIKSLGKYKSTYDFAKWYMNNRTSFYSQIESEGRKAAVSGSAGALDNQFGYINKSRKAEIYSVKKYKDYDYTDVILAFDQTSKALIQIEGSRDRSEAMDALDNAREMWLTILEESNLQNKKERINAKVSAMIWCNLAEIAVWMADFNEADNQVSKTMNSGVFKAKSHIKGEKSFYADQKTRWNANFE
ncbi:hypothetical protein OAK92_00080 [Crocinitomicaceae bacterium]|jgi:hypothetical protein|nr:hypothetical protein [Crocinitomicaceae bacterium]